MPNIKISEYERMKIMFIKSSIANSQKDIEISNLKHSIVQMELQNYLSSLYIKYGINESYALAQDGEFVLSNNQSNEEKQGSKTDE